VIRQGDILLVPVVIPEGAKEVKHNKKEGIIVAEGEVTGHHHRIRDPRVRELNKGSRRFIRVPKRGPVALFEHEEHATLTLPPPVKPNTGYEIRNQREYVAPQDTTSAPRTRRVVD